MTYEQPVRKYKLHFNLGIIEIKSANKGYVSLSAQ